MSQNGRTLVRILTTLVLFVALLTTFYFVKNVDGWIIITAYFALYLLIGYDVIFDAVKSIFHGEIFDENFLMTVASLCAFTPLVAEYGEAVAVMWLFQVGELFQRYAVGKSRKSVENLLKIRPETATVLRDGKQVNVHPSQVEIGETLVVLPGQKIAVDGVVTSGTSSVNTSAITGESLPVFVQKGDTVASGTVNIDGVLYVTTTCLYDDSTVAKILDAVENASNSKAPTEKFITRFSRYYTPIVVILAVILAVLPPIFSGEWSTWLRRAMMFLFVSCPCALVISVPLGFFGGIASASKNGVLVKGSNYLEMLAKVNTMAFDKTGTLTTGTFEITDVLPHENASEVLQLAVNVEQMSTHPLAVSVCKNGTPTERPKVTEQGGKGVVASFENGDVVLCGNALLLHENGVTVPQIVTNGTAIHLAKNGKYFGTITFADSVKEGAKSTVSALEKQGVNVAMLTGDNRIVADDVANRLGIKTVFAELSPMDKVDKLNELKRDGKVAFVGDGINDAPVIATADLGIAMGKLGSAATIEQSDVVIVSDNIGAICTARKTAKKTLGIVRQNIVMALGVKFAVLLLSALGVVDSLILAIFADVGTMALAVLNSMRTLSHKN